MNRPYPPQQRQSQSSALKIVAFVVVAISGLIFLTCAGGMFWLFTGPEGGVRMANEMEEYAVEYLEEHNLLHQDERLRAYYDVTIRMNGTESYVLTDKRVLHHRRDAGDHELRLSNIAYVDATTDGIGSTIITIVDLQGGEMRLEIAPFNGGDSFMQALERAREPYRAEEVYPIDGEVVDHSVEGAGDGVDESVDEGDEREEAPVD
jgi:hypothetical protein